MRKLLFVCFMLFAGLTMSSAQIAKFQALYLLQFAKNTSWPAEDNGKPFVITVIGDNSVASELRSISANKTIGTRSISIVEKPSAAALEKSDIIYLGEAKSGQIGNLVTAQSGNKVLIVSGSKGQCSQGAGIAFVPDGGKLNFEIHKGNIAKNGLSVTNKLIQLGKEVF